ncbi:solute carrier family 22 member 4-like [Ostrea edulis]|uniref:solute carrier family 22 member 4-like n=1 Tax=Ostrea edulis TaxID=37623 RepID=UPI0024AFF0E7|nr:solute carrier family 22 member 4-like [Ostrea edulis]
MESLNFVLEDIITECGGFGRFQYIVIAVAFLVKVTCAWSILMMQFAGSTPEWWCTWTTNTSLDYFGNTSVEDMKVCKPLANESATGQCSDFRFSSEIKTIVNEWALICDKDWVTSTITTIQMGGLLVAGLLSGHLADTFGRKLTFFLSLVVMMIGNFIAAFSVSWQMFAVLRFVIGFGAGQFLATLYIYMIEFIPKKHRSLIAALPTFPIFAALLALVSYLIKDWRHLHFVTAALTLPSLLGIFVIPESFRWLASRFKIKEAGKVINKIAWMNGCPPPDVSKIQQALQNKNKLKDRKYSVIDIFREKYLLKRTVLLWFCWISCGFSYYGLAFGVGQLSGSLYINMFLLSAVEIPGTFSTWCLTNQFGRRWTCLVLLLLSSLGGLATGTVQTLDPESVPNHGLIVTVLAITAKLAISAAWTSIITMTTELYPTVIRNISYGFFSAVSRVGAMVAPQVIFLSKTIPGLLYFVIGSTLLVSSVFAFLLPETKGRPLEDHVVVEESVEQMQLLANSQREKDEINT